jgi:hypothetical protein
VLQQHPTLAFTYAVAILYTSDRRAQATMDLLQAPLEMAEGHWRAEGNLSRLGQVLSFKTMVAWFQEIPKSWRGPGSAEMLPWDVFWRSLQLIGGVRRTAGWKANRCSAEGARSTRNQQSRRERLWNAVCHLLPG